MRGIQIFLELPISNVTITPTRILTADMSRLPDALTFFCTPVTFSLQTTARQRERGTERKKGRVERKRKGER